LHGAVLSLLDGFDDVLVPPFLPDSPVVALDIGVLLRLAGLAVQDDDDPFLSPDHVGRVWHGQNVRFVPLQPFSGFDPQVPFHLTIDPIDPPVVPRGPFHVAQMQKTQAKPQVFQASVSPTSRSAISSFQAFNFGLLR
jgi:hypothetical protein